MCKNDLKKAWELAASKKLIPDNVVQEHFERAEKINWNYAPIIRCDVQGTLESHNPTTGEEFLHKQIYGCLQLFKEAGREIFIITSGNISKADRRLSDLNISEEFLPVYSREGGVITKDDFNRDPDLHGILPPLELIFDDNRPYTNSHVTHIHPQELKI